METTKRIVILLILGLLAVGTSQSAEEAERPVRRISNTRTASCMVKITCDPAILPLNLETIDYYYLLRSSGVGGKAARETLQLSTEEVHDLFSIEYVQLLTSDAHDSVPPLPSRRGSRLAAPPTPSQPVAPGIGKSGFEGTNEYEYEMMMEDEMPIVGGEYSLPGASSPAARSKSILSSRRGTTRTLRTPPTARRTPYPTSTSSTDGQTCLFSLNIHLPEKVKPAAKEFMEAIVDNLRHAILDAYDAYMEELQSLLRFTEDRRDRAQTQLANATEQVEAIKMTPAIGLNPADAAVHEQLEQFVDLSNLTQSMTFEDVITELKNSVDPPLQIQPNWKDLLEMADLESTTPAMIDPLTGIKLRKALEVLLAGVSSEFATIDYVVDEGVIVIATENALPSKLATVVYQRPGLDTTGLVQLIQNTIEPDSWYDAGKISSRKIVNYSTGGMLGPAQVLQKETGKIGKGKIVSYPPNKLVILQTYDVHQKIDRFLRHMTIDIPASTPSQIPTEMIISEKRSLLREKQNIEMEIARLLARQLAIERQIAVTEKQIAAKLETDPVTAELQQLVEMHASQLALVERQLEAGRLPAIELADMKEKLTRAKIELAQRHEQLSKSAGGDQLTKYNNELADITIEFAEKTAALRVLSEQLGQTEQQLTAATVIDPQVSRMRQATRAFEIADQRVNELNTRAANSQPPVVSILGAE